MNITLVRVDPPNNIDAIPNRFPIEVELSSKSTN